MITEVIMLPTKVSNCNQTSKFLELPIPNPIEKSDWLEQRTRQIHCPGDKKCTERHASYPNHSHSNATHTTKPARVHQQQQRRQDDNISPHESWWPVQIQSHQLRPPHRYGLSCIPQTLTRSLETYNIPFYLQYLSTWPTYCSVIEGLIIMRMI